MKLGCEVAFGLFQMLPRQLVPIESGMTVKEVGSCTLAIEECEELQHPICFISTEVQYTPVPYSFIYQTSNQFAQFVL